MDPRIAARIIFSLGIVNVVSGILIFFSCRCLPGSHVGKALMLMNNAFYQRFFKLHCIIWWVFWISVMVHAVMAFVYIGLP